MQMNGSIPSGNATRRITSGNCAAKRDAKREGNRRLRRSARDLHLLDYDDATDTFRYVRPSTEWDVS